MAFHIFRAFHHLDDDALKRLWEQPMAFQNLFDSATWILHGRKGVGKSSLVEYVRRIELPGDAFVVDLSRDGLLQTVFDAVKAAGTDDQHEVQFAAVVAFELALVALTTAFLCKRHKRLHGGEATGPLANVQGFLINERILSPSGDLLPDGVIQVAISAHQGPRLKYAAVTAGLRRTMNSLLAEFTTYCKVLTTQVLVCLDNVDDDHFSFSRIDQLLINTLVSSVMDLNDVQATEGTSLRFVLSCPSELFELVSVWNVDKIKIHASRVVWRSEIVLKKIVNRAIHYHLSQLRASNPSLKAASVNTTWSTFFPQKIKDEYGWDEDTFSYLLRHTQYNPRQLLLLVQELGTELEAGTGEKFPIANDRYGKEPQMDLRWSLLVTTTVARESIEIVRGQTQVFARIFKNYSALLDVFRSQPVIWTRKNLLDYLSAVGAHLDPTDHFQQPEDKRRISGEELVFTLQKLGILGLGYRENEHNMHATYRIHFSFIEGRPYQDRWEIAAFTPLYYSELGLRTHSDLRVIVSPDKPLTIPDRIFEWYETYNHADRSGTYQGKDLTV